MVSRNNRDLYLRKSANKVSKYTIKKLSVGVTSVLVGTAFFLGQATGASAAEQNTNTDKQQEIVTQDDSSTNSNGQTIKVNAALSTSSTNDDVTTATDTSETAEANENTQTQASSSTSTNDATTAITSSTKEEQNTQVDNSKQENSVTNESTKESTLSNNDETKTAVSQVNEETAADKAQVVETNPVFRAATTADDNSTSITVNNWMGLVNALNSSQYDTINVNGTITAGSGSVYANRRNVVIKGTNNNSGINFGTNPLKVNGNLNLTFDNLNLITSSANGAVTFTGNNSTVTFKDVRHSGASLYGGSGKGDVVIDGVTTSTVSTSSKPTVNTYKANGNDANIWGAKSVTVKDGANFTLNRSAIGDGINLPDGSTVRVGDNATMTINMNTNNATDSARYHDAGIFMLNGGNFLTGKNSTVNMNTSIGQAVSIGATRPNIATTDKDRFGGYAARSRNAGPTTVTFGDYSTFNFTGRDGFILGNNANFTSGEYSNVHFQNKGRGVALNLAANSNILISKHSNTLFESNGKTGVSGSYDGYNYIGVNEGGNITIDEYATFRVILTGRGDNPWDDVISLDSQNANTHAAFTSKKGAVVDIRDDNTNFYAELISFPLGAAQSVIDIQDPLYLNLQRYSAGGATTGWMPVGGVSINTTNEKYTANLIYMGGTKGVLKIGGTDYVVYQQIKSDSAQQIWLNVNSVEFDKNGFAAKNIWDNGANPDSSIRGIGLTAGVLANDIKDNQTPPTVKGAKGTAPYYGISTMRASHQIWFPHSTETQAAGQHQNVIKYVYEDGTEAAPTVTQTVDVTRDLILDLTPDQINEVKAYAARHTADQILDYIKSLYVVTKDSGWKVVNGSNTKTAYDAVATPEIAGYTASIKSTNANGVTVGGNAASIHATLDMPNDTVVENGKLTEAFKNNNGVAPMPANYETVIVYKKVVQQQPVTIIYQDKTENNKVLETKELKGTPGDSLGYTTKDTIASYVAKGYKLVSDGVPANATFGDAPETYYVTLEHDTAPVGPTDPHEPGTPINPNDPDGPKWPEKDNYEKEYTSTVEFVDEQGNKMPNIPDDKQTSTWTRTLNVDKVTGEILNPNEAWTPDKPNYSKVNVPVVPGYYADKSVVPEKPTEQKDLVEKVVYKPMGKVTPVDPEGNPIPNAPTPQYPNDPTDPTQGGKTPVPDIPGWHVVPNQDTPGLTPDGNAVVPNTPGEDTPVKYEKDEVAKYSLVEKFVDEDGKELAPNVTKGTDYEAGSAYDVTGDAKVIDGYYLKTVSDNAKGTFGKDNVTVTFTYAKLGKIIPVDPEGNPIPDAPTPQYPNDPTDPTQGGKTPVPDIPGWHVVPNQDTPGLTPDGNAVVPNTPGEDTPVKYEKDEVAKYSLVEKFVDEDGKELAPNVTKGTDYEAGSAYDVTGDAKVIDGYYLKTVSDNAKGTFGKDNVTVTFTYAKLGKIIPVDPEGNPIPDAPTPQYPNDPTDPTKGGKTPVPDIPGMTPEVPSVTPTDPGKDTEVVYNYDDQKATINYIDETTGQTITSDNVTGKGSTKIAYSTAAKIKELTDKGYVLVSDGFPADATFDNDKNTDQVFDVILKHGEKPVGPTDPHEPDTPINPNDPDGPKWPAKDQYSKDYTSTITYVDDKGNKVADDNVQTSTWTRTLLVDTVTGEVKNPNEAWTADKAQYDAVKSPLVDGYYADKATVAAKDTKQENLTEEVVYRPLGKIIPVDPEGNPIPDAPTPQYPNDPTDPGKTTPDQPVPEIPGYRPEVPSVTPTDPGKDTPVKYVPIENAKYTLTERFVDEEGNEISPSVVKGTDYEEGSEYDVTGDAKVIDGYYLKETSNTTGKFGKGDMTATFTYAKLGKIIPVDPEGNPIPDAPTPQYPNDPTDPGKTTPDQPVPEIPGYRPEVPSVTPTDPGKDTPVKYVPIENAKYTLTERFVDEEGNEISPSVVKGTDYEEGSEYDVTGDAKVIDGYYLKETSNTTGKFGKGDMTATFTYAKLGKIIPVDPEGNPIPDAPTPQYPNDPTDPGKTTPDQPVPEIPGYRPEVPSVTPTDPGKDTPVKYVPIENAKYTLTERFVDEDGNEISPSVIKGTDYEEGSEYDVTGDAKVIDGYYLKETSNTTGKFGKGDMTATFTYAKLGKIIPVDPEGNPIPDAPTPQYPNDPTDPGKTTPDQPVPEIPGYRPEVPSVTPTDPGKDTPVKYVPIENAKYTLTERFVDEEGNEISPSVVKGTDYEEGSEYDVTGDAKVIDGYYLKETSNTTGKFGKGDMTATFTYAKLGKIIPVDPEGNPIPDAPTPQYPNDPTDPGKTTPDQPVPEIPGYRPEVPSVTPTDPGKDTPVKYVPIENAKYTLTERFVDEDGNEISPSVIKGTDYEEGSEYDVTGDAKVIDGYYLKETSNTTGKFGKGDMTATFTYAKLGKIIPVDPEGNPIPDAPTPQYPNNPTDPGKTTPDQPVPEIPGYRPEVPSVTPTDPGKDTPVKYVPIENAKYTLTERFVDEEGNEISPSVVKGTDYEEGSEYDVTGDAKVIDGYYLKETSNTTGKFGKGDMTATFTYAKLGKIIPVDPEGNPIPDAPTPQYPNDPTDPGKTTPDQPVPEIPGYRPEVPSVTPTDPGEDTPVKYIPVTPEKHVQTAKIVYVDTKTGTTIESDSVTGNVGDKIDYSTTSRITELTKKGYVLIEDGFTNAGTPVYNDNGEEQVFVVKLGHGTEPVGPNNPHEPGTPINPDDPNGPKWPAKDDYTKQYTSTVHFVDSNGNKLRDDDIQTSTWTRTLIVDKVTGEVLNPSEPWKSDIDDYATVKVPVIEGYYADRATVPGETAQQRDLETTVTYNKIGKIVPVDPNGNPIPNVPTPQYRNDPNDPTKVIVTDTPDIPGMIPETRSVTPGKPGVDTPVVYHKVETPEQKPEQPAQPEVTPVVNGPVQTPAPKAETPATELPQTGDKQGNALAAVGASIVAGMLGLIGFTKKKKDEKDF
ncbi:MucBP domain-containing protein [Ligilactobacillus murinus]|uniref:YSIRK-type signal peptide-containing protein n=11 Tax=Ligilactobacillus murinus TaxID=1622 RepID=A0AAE6WFA3_9LACO|nr:MucBP domain-containing protein [Ligilactobacillus murinus]QIA89621.1 YSIRK-type signal peptide-containing protein [Ligilactobacillus murinus]